MASTVGFSNDTNVTTYDVISGSATFSGISYDDANGASARGVFRDAIGRLSANITENRVTLTHLAASARRRLSDGVVVDFEISVTAAEMAAVEEDLQAAKNDPSLLDAALTAAAAASADATMTALFANIKTESFDPDIGSTPAPTTPARLPEALRGEQYAFVTLPVAEVQAGGGVTEDNVGVGKMINVKESLDPGAMLPGVAILTRRADALAMSSVSWTSSSGLALKTGSPRRVTGSKALVV